jgi:hypothetical protein
MTDNDETPKNDAIPRAISGLIFEQLQQYDRFNMFIQSNYHISLMKNDEDKRIEVIVEEILGAVATENLVTRVKDRNAKRKTGNIVIAKADALTKLKN